MKGRIDVLEEYVVVDLEMTGLNPRLDRILEIGAVRAAHGEITGTFRRMVNPRMKLSEKVTEITGITDEMARDGCGCAEAVKDFLEFAGDLDFVGHNLIYDYGFLKQAAANQGIALERKGIDTLKLARRLLPEAEKKSLDYLCGYLHIARGMRHRALDDAMATAELLRYLWKRFGEKEPELFAGVPLQYKAKKQQPASARQKRRLGELLSYHKMELDVEVESLTRSEASRITDQILSGQIPVKHFQDGVFHQ